MLFLGGGLFLRLLLLLMMTMTIMTVALASTLILPSFPVTRLTRIHLVLLSKIPPVVLLHSTLHSTNGIGDMLHCIRPLNNFSGPPGFPLYHLKFISQVTSFNGLLFLSGSLPLLIVLLMMVMTMTALVFPSMSLEISFPWRLLLPLRLLLGMMVMVVVVVCGRIGCNGSLDVLLGVGRVCEISFPWRLLLPLRFLLGMMVMVVVCGRIGFDGCLDVLLGVGRVREGVVCGRRGFNGSLDILLGVGGVREGVVSVRTTRESLRGWESDYRGGCYESDDGSSLKTHY